jgi:hypothetical protein
MRWTQQVLSNIDHDPMKVTDSQLLAPRIVVHIHTTRRRQDMASPGAAGFRPATAAVLYRRILRSLWGFEDRGQRWYYKNWARGGWVSVWKAWGKGRARGRRGAVLLLVLCGYTMSDLTDRPLHQTQATSSRIRTRMTGSGWAFCWPRGKSTGCGCYESTRSPILTQQTNE